MKLRPYQREAVDAIYNHLRNHDDNPCAVLPTGAGKTLLMATICKDAVEKWQGRVLILAHVKELLQQACEKIKTLAPEMFWQTGIYSAGLRSRQTDEAIIIAGIQSVYKRACELGPFNLIIVDEAHYIPPDGEGMYQTFLTEARVVNPKVRTIGLTATPFRTKSGMICAPENILNAICYEASIKELIRDGYLCPLTSKVSRTEVNTDNLHVRAGEFIQSEVEELMSSGNLINDACREITSYCENRNSVLIFAAGVEHGRKVAETISTKYGEKVGVVFGDSLNLEREDTLRAFKAGELKYLVNYAVLTHGFDAPNIDCVVLLRPTKSPGLYYQACGRGFRLHESKENCLILDYGNNIVRHGPVDAIEVPDPTKKKKGEAPAKVCPQCMEAVAMGYAICPECGFQFPDPEKEQHDGEASNEAVLSGEVTTEDYEVIGVSYSVHSKRNAAEDAPKTMRVDYDTGWVFKKSEWVCFEHSGYARQKAESWWQARSNDPVPSSAEEAVRLANLGCMANTTQITVRSVSGDKYDSIIGYEIGEKPEAIEPGSFDDEDEAGDYVWSDSFSDDEVPF